MTTRRKFFKAWASAKRKVLKRRNALFLVLALLGGIFALAFAATQGVAVLGPPQGAPDIGVVHDQSVENTTIGPYDTFPYFPENVIGGTGGRLSPGNIFFIEPRPQLYTGLWIQVEMVNRKEINEHWTSFTENLGLYLAVSDNSERWVWDNMWKRIDEAYLTLVGAPATFEVSRVYSGYAYVDNYENIGGTVTDFENAQADDGNYENIYENTDNVFDVYHYITEVPRDHSYEIQIEYHIEGTNEEVELYLWDFDAGQWVYIENLSYSGDDTVYTLTLTDDNYNFRALINDNQAENVHLRFRQADSTVGRTSLMIDYVRIFHSTTMGADHPMVVALDRGDFWAKEGYWTFPGITHYLSIEEAAY